jgi:hypothetical protein
MASVLLRPSRSCPRDTRPASFDYTTPLRRFTVYGYRFASDRPGEELLTIRAASRDGLTLTGSGHVRVTTPALYRPLHVYRVRVERALRLVRATSSGALDFTVDLGPGHAADEFAPDTQARMATDPSYLQTRTVTIQS